MNETVLNESHPNLCQQNKTVISMDKTCLYKLKNLRSYFMKIDLSDKYCITTDEYNFILQEKRIIGSRASVTRAPDSKNIGKIRYNVLGYFPNLPFLIKYLLNHEILVSHASSFFELTALLQECTDKIIKSLDPYNITKEMSTQNDSEFAFDNNSFEQKGDLHAQK